MRTRADSKAALPEAAGPVLVPILQGGDRTAYLLGAGLWLAAFLYFWIWWLKPEHNIGAAAYCFVSVLLAWITVIPVYFLIVFFGGRRLAGPLRLPAGSRVAMVVTKAPSEPFSVVAETLTAMLAQDYPHHTWLADEAPTSAVRDWCAEHDVFISTRKDRPDYHRTSWPRRTRCKEGNLAFFYDHYGYEYYDFAVQLDADHVPRAGYLREMLKPFADPGVGYVSAPSICDKNAAGSWSARGRLHAEASLHGSLQAGYNGGWAPLCIGSHYAVRTAALREIGGLGPELAEDHSTTLMMNAFGWRGVHALDAIAHGDGPRTFADLITQEFQWSRSLVTILLKYSPLYVPYLPARLCFQFLFSQLWYPLFSLFMAASFALPIVALTFKINFVDVTYPEFFVHFVPMSLVLVLLALLWRSGGTFRPGNAKVLSWEVIVFLFARWPWALAGTLAALRDWATNSFVDFRITPKGAGETDPLPARVLAPYLALSTMSAVPALAVSNAGFGAGFYIFAIVNAVLYGAIPVVALIRHEIENRIKGGWVARLPATAATLAAMFALPALALEAHGLQGLDAISRGAVFFRLTETTYGISGAGLGDERAPRVAFRPRWTFGGPELQPAYSHLENSP